MTIMLVIVSLLPAIPSPLFRPMPNIMVSIGKHGSSR